MNFVPPVLVASFAVVPDRFVGWHLHILKVQKMAAQMAAQMATLFPRIDGYWAESTGVVEMKKPATSEYCSGF
jgi:hypothetical protein